MVKRLGIVAFIHILAITLLFLPTRYKGSFAIQISSAISLRVLDIIAIAIIFIGSFLLYYWIYTFSKKSGQA